MRRHLPLVVPLAVLAIAVGGGALALAAAPQTGAAIRAGLPGPDKTLPQRGTVQFAGQDATKTFSIAVVRGARGAVLAYVCDGLGVGRWLTGTAEDGVANLTGPKGATMRVTFARKRATGSARFGATRIAFSLPRAIKASGLRRLVERSGTARIEAAWIVTNAGVTRGIASEDGGKTVATSSSTSSPTGPDAGVEVPPGATPPEPTILRKFRCSRLVLAHNRAQNDLLNGRNPDGPNPNEIRDRFAALGCADFFVL